MATPAETIEQLKGLYQNLTNQQRLMAAGVIALTLAAFAGLLIWVNSTEYRPLYTGLSPDTAAEVVEALKKEKVEYRLSNGGTTILVPADRVYDIRLMLAGAGVPSHGEVGFEVFDKSNLGATDFVERVNYLRALQGELERTIARFKEVEYARVHIAMPKESLFVSQRREPTASVVLKLKPGASLDPSQVKAIVHLVASGVPKLDKQHITVVDTDGELLYDASMEKNDLYSLTKAQLAYQQRLESYYKQKIQSMLESALGPGKAIARVSVDVDFDRTTIDEDRYDPDSFAARSQEKRSEVTTRRQPGGIPGVKGGLANKLQGNVGRTKAGLVTQKQEEITNYEISRTRRRVQGAVGKIRRISVAVMVDGVYKKKGGKVEYVPRSEEEMGRLSEIVKTAMGYDESRGDEVSVVNVPFSAPPKRGRSMEQMVEIGAKLAKPIANLLIALLFILFILKPLLTKYVLAPKEEEPLPQELVEAVTGEEAMALEEAETALLEPGPSAQEELQNLASNYPERAAALIKIWLREPVEEA